jgi:cyanophycin synthetase
VGEGYVLLDYGHNPGALACVCRMATQWHGYSATGIVSAPGDRSDELIEEAGRIAARGFSRIIIREDKDPRGRAPGEVAQLLLRAVRQEVPERDCQVVLDECEAVEQELKNIREGNIIVLFYDQIEPIKTVLAAHGAVPASTIDTEIMRFNIAKA